MKYIKRFKDIRKEDVAMAGGKGANLGELVSAGISVPPGAVILSPAYDRFLEANRIDTSDKQTAEQIRKAIISSPIPPEIEEEIRDYYMAFGENARVAIRSSATAEDLDDASFAGQQETYLNVIGIEEVLKKVRECYVSLWGDRAVSYRRNAGYHKVKTALAVVVQEMIESETSGVMFTADPAGDPDDLHINASYGLGEAVVSGIVSPDEFICDRNGNIKRTVMGSKECMIVYSGAGTIKRETDKGQRKVLSLSEDMVRSLVDVGLKIEAHYGHPMDIEWGIRDGKIYILQARSITTLGDGTLKQYAEEDFAKYPKVKAATGAMREDVLFNLEKTPTPYFPLDHDFGGFVGEQKAILFGEIGLSSDGSMYPIDEDGVNLLMNGKKKITKNIFRIPHYLKLLSDIDHNMSEAKKSLDSCRQRFETLKDRDTDNAGQIGTVLKSMRELIGDTAYGRFLYALFPNFLQSRKVNRVLKKIDKDLNSYDILDGLEYVTADINREMAEMARLIRADADMKNIVLSMDYEHITEKYPELKKLFSEFLKEYGGKSDFNCYCFISSSWREKPDRFINVLRPMLKGAEVQVLKKEEGLKHLTEIMDKAKAVLPDGKYKAFEHQVKGLRYYHYIREATQYLWECEFEYCRKLLRKLSDITSVPYEDYLYLFADEFYRLLEHGMDDKTQALIERRKEMRPLAVAYWNKAMSDALASDEKGICGVGGAVGQASGRVCIVRSPQEFDKLSEGDVLVCTYTDPEWTPLFTLASAVVVDTGGTLSHAAIVAREYHIPAVLATGNATALLHDGDMVMVDGGSGRVSIL